jgi:hypothetical protein
MLVRRGPGWFQRDCVRARTQSPNVDTPDLASSEFLEFRLLNIGFYFQVQSYHETKGDADPNDDCGDMETVSKGNSLDAPSSATYPNGYKRRRLAAI